jgi:hypothetical protein
MAYRVAWPPITIRSQMGVDRHPQISHHNPSIKQDKDEKRKKKKIPKTKESELKRSIRYSKLLTLSYSMQMYATLGVPMRLRLAVSDNNR